MNALVEGINRFADTWWFWTLHAAWQSAVVGCVILAVVACARRWPAPVRYWLLVIALVKFAAPPLWSAPTGVFSHLAVAERASAIAAVGDAPFEPTIDDSKPTARPPADVGEPQQTQISGPSHARLSAEASADRLGSAKFTEPVTSANPTAIAVAPHTSASGVETAQLTWKSVLLAVYAIGATILLAWLAVQFGSVRRIVSRARPVESGPIAESLGRVSTRLVLPRSARVLVSPDVASPLATGAWRPTVVLPKSAAELPPRELDAVLVHELTHLRRGDAWLAWVQVLLCAAWWFHPVIWLVNRSLRRVREDCCDDAILISGVATGSEYCDILLHVARDATARHADLLACHMAGRLHPLGDRLRRIMDTRVHRWRRTPWAVAVAVVVLACVALPGLGRHVSQSVAASDGAQPNGRGTAGDSSTKKISPPTMQRPDSAKSEETTKRTAAAAPPVTDPFAEKVRTALARGRSFLAAAQNPDGSFVYRGSEAGAIIFMPGAHPQETGNWPRYAVGATSLTVLALLSAGEKSDGPVIAKSLEFLRHAPTTATYFSTYENSLEIAALVAAKSGDRDRSRITALAQSLEKNQIRLGHHAGIWSYGDRGSGSGDNSNTQFALYGLYAAARAGVPVKRETWERSCDHFVEFQNQDGGWGYRDGNSSTGSMTCGAVASLALCDQMLLANRPPDGQLTPGDGDEKQTRREIALKRGIGWIGRYFRIDINPGQGGLWTLYYLFEMSRAGRLSGQALFGKHDWYHEGASYLIDGQSRFNGSWDAAWGSPESGKFLATSFALLFLSAPSGGEQAIKINAAPTRQGTAVPSVLVAQRDTGNSSQATASAKTNPERNRFDGKFYLLHPHKVHASGQATNEKGGAPVAGATVYVVANNRYGIPQPVLAIVKTDAKGGYDVPELSLPVLEFPPQPTPHVTEGSFQVAATAAGYGYTWRRSMTFRPGPRPANVAAEAGDEGPVVYEGEPIRLDLHFEPEAKVHGRITNDLGEPLKGAKVEFGTIHDVRRFDSPDNVMWRCVYLPNSPFAAEKNCDVTRFLPPEFLSTRTDAEGRYVMHGLPREAELSFQIEPGEEYTAYSGNLQTTQGATEKRTARLRSGGELNYVLAAPREIRVLVTQGSNGIPAAGVTLRARTRQMQRAGNEATTGGDGVATLHLAPGKCTLIAEPPPNLPLVRSTRQLTIEKSRRQEVALSLERAATVRIHVLDNVSRKPVEGAVLFSEKEGGSGAARLQSQTVFNDNPVTDQAGNLRANIPAGRWRFFAARDSQPPSQRTSTAWIDLSPGSETTVPIAVRGGNSAGSSQSATSIKMGPTQRRFEEVREEWYRLGLLASRGRYRIRVHTYLRGDVSRERLTELLRACEGKTPEQCVATLASVFPALRDKLGREEQVVDRERFRGSSFYPHSKHGGPAPDYVFVFNGQETITYQRDNAQADIYGIDNAVVGYWRLLDSLGPTGNSTRKPEIIVSGDKWHGTVAEEGDRLRFELGDASKFRSEYLVEAKTGFPFHWVHESSARHFAQEGWNFGPMRQPNGAILPTVHVQFRYGNEKLTDAQLAIIDKVELLDRVPPESFVLAVDAGTNVLDHRGIPMKAMTARRRPRSTVVTEPVGDVVARANEARD